jgi:Ricin-type beta-trefoil lectin domain-like
MYGSSYNLKCQSFYMESWEGGYRIVNDLTRYYAHADDDGKANLRMFDKPNSKCQVFELEPKGDTFRLKNKHSGFYIHADSNGTGNLRMYNEVNDVCQLVAFYVLTTKPVS